MPMRLGGCTRTRSGYVSGCDFSVLQLPGLCWVGSMSTDDGPRCLARFAASQSQEQQAKREKDAKFAQSTDTFVFGLVRQLSRAAPNLRC